MADRPDLVASERELSKRGQNRLHSKGVVPGNLFDSTQQPVSLLVSRFDLQRLVDHRGRGAVLFLKVGERATVQVIMRHLEYNPISGEIVHVDFYEVVAP